MNRAPTLRSPYGERGHLPWVGTVLRTVRAPIEQAAGSESPPYLKTTRSARSADPTQGITPPILHTRYSILSASLANQSTRVASLVPSGPQALASSSLPLWPTDQRVN